MTEPVITVEKEASFASSLKRGQLSTLLNDPNTPASVLLVICMDHFGTDFFKWEPDTLRMELRDELSVEPPQSNIDKVWGLVTALTTNLFFVSLETFIPICNVLSDSEASFTHFDPADVEEMAWAVAEVHLIDPMENSAEQFSDDIRLYAGERLRSEGFVRAPELLSWATFKDEDEGDRPDMFEDDPVMFNAIWDRQQADINAVNQYVHGRLSRVTELLKSLPLIRGSVDKLFRKKST